MGQTLLDKVWEGHVARRVDGLPDLLYVDLHLVHEVTSPQAFEALRQAGRTVRRPDHGGFGLLARGTRNQWGGRDKHKL